MKPPSAPRYAVLVWLTTVVGAPVVFLMAASIGNIIQWGSAGKPFLPIDFIIPLVAMMFAGGLLSFPSGLLFLLATYIVCRGDSTERLKRWTLFGVGVMLTLLTIVVLGEDLSKLKEAVTSYAIFFFLIPLCWGIFYYRIPVVGEENEQSGDLK